MKPITLATTFLLSSLLSAAAHAATLRTVALSGQQVPGMPDGTVFTGFGSPVLNDAGQTAFKGSYSNGSNFGQGVLSEGAGSLNLVGAVGQQVPGMPDGVTYYNFPNPGRIVINDAGQTAFGAEITGPGVNFTNSEGIWSSGPDGSAPVARSGEQAVGAPAGVVYEFDSERSTRQFCFNDAGQVAFQSHLYDSGAGFYIGYGIGAKRDGGLELVARKGNHAPGTPDGVNFSDLSFPGFTLNNRGQTAFPGILTGSGVDETNNTGIWSEGSGSLALVAREGSQAPGMPDGAVFNSVVFSAPELNNAGQTAFASQVTGGGVDATNNNGIWLSTAGNLSLAVREGAQAPGTPSGVNFGNSTSWLALNDAGQIAFLAGLSGAGVSSINSLGLWSGAPGSLALVARTGDHAPGTGDGVVFRSLISPITGDLDLMLNAAGQTALVGQLAGSGINSSNLIGIWATDSHGALQLIARAGDQLEVAPGDFRTIGGLVLPFTDSQSRSTGNADGRPSAFNNRGQLAFRATFTDGTSGIFVSNRVAIPEPSALALVAVGVVALLAPIGWRQSKIKQRSQFSIDFDDCRRGQAAQSADDCP
jgi:hypothetical protein